MTRTEPLLLSRGPAAAPEHRAGGAARERVGEILVRLGALDAQSPPVVVAHQARTRQLFGEAAVSLRLVDATAVVRALAEQAKVAAESLARVSPEIVVAHEPFGREAERVRDLRATLLLGSSAEGRLGRGRVIAIVSPGAGEGRSWLAANLAASFAQRARRTVLVDADLRAPRQHRLFGVEGHEGLVGALGGRGDEPVVNGVPAVPHLDVLCAGSRPSNPQELLSHESFNRMLRSLASESDTVIVDTPAAGPVADFLFAAAAADTVLLLARRGRTRIAAVRELSARLAALGRPPAGIVYNER
jgi:capsular exopolysaccharide synthesis family protein